METETMNEQLDQLLIEISEMPFEKKFALLTPLKIALAQCDDACSFTGMGASLENPQILLIAANKDYCDEVVWNVLMAAYSLHRELASESMIFRDSIENG